MCGFVGVWSEKCKGSELKHLAERMLATIKYRGPDGEGFYYSEKDNLALGHCRLSIMDPEHGQQPMYSNDRETIIVFNGAIYNHLELRRELTSKGCCFNTFCDTETILYAYRVWGEDCLKHLRGMFAFAIYDLKQSKIFLAKDRMSIKPLYYYFNEQHFIFGSEIKALLASDLISKKVNESALQDYLTFQFSLGEKTLFNNIKKLEAGHYMLVDLSQKKCSVKIKQYWDLKHDDNVDNYSLDSPEKLTSLLTDAVRLHLRSDVALGAHLSGGLDSSIIVSLASSILEENNLHTFTGKFSQADFDESYYAKIVAKHNNVNYHEVLIEPAPLSEFLPEIIWHMDEPMAGPGVIPQYFVAKEAAKYVKVVLGGQGGDELFVGYARYIIVYLESLLKNAICSNDSNEIGVTELSNMIPNLGVLSNYVPMLKQFWSSGLFESEERRYFKLIERMQNFSNIINPDLFASDYSSYNEFEAIFNKYPKSSLINKMLYFDLKSSLPALLHVEDRTSMAASIESRVPFLDHAIVEYANHIPSKIKVKDGKMKDFLKQSMKNIVPKEIIDRKDKMGFPVPMRDFVYNNDFVKDLLSSKGCLERGIFKKASILRLINDKSMTYDRTLWGAICLELWFKTFFDGA